MEKKIKHRIIGGFVVIGLGIIMLPLFQTKSDLTTQVTVVKAPPFPDQAVLVSAADSKPFPITQDENSFDPNIKENLSQAGQSNNTLKSANPSVVNNAPPAEYIPPQNQQQMTSQSTPQQSDANVPLQSQQSVAKSTDETEVQAPRENDDLEVDQSVYSADEGEDVPQVRMTEHHASKNPIVSPIKKANRITKSDGRHSHTSTVHTAKNQIPVTTKIALNDNGLFDLSKAAWVIQLGSFKNKANALRLVNQLRANGYHAFIQKISTTFGEHTRVFVGPENKRLSANALADRLENEMHVKGIVISYQPLTL